MSGNAVSAKNLQVAPIDSSSARAFVRKHHYSGKVVNNSVLHFGVFWNNKLEGVMQFGNPIDKSKTIGLVHGTKWNGFLELNRMAFSDNLPRNSESRALAVAFRLIRKHAPHIEWVISYADATQCGDGTIYRASGFKLIGIKENTDLFRMPDGEVIHKLNFQASAGGQGENSIKHRYQRKGTESGGRFLKRIGANKLAGFQIRYFYPLHADALSRLAVPIMPFSIIDELNARMYRGKNYKRSGGGSADSGTLIIPDEKRRCKSDPTARS